MLQRIIEFITANRPNTKITIHGDDDRGVTKLNIFYDGLTYNLETTTEYVDEDIDCIFAILERARTRREAHHALFKLCDTGVPF